MHGTCARERRGIKERESNGAETEILGIARYALQSFYSSAPLTHAKLAATPVNHY